MSGQVDDPTGIARLIAIMAQLRDPERGCPWDVQQDFATIAPYTIEEAYEVADAIERKDYPHLCDELGDLLLQVVFHARMAEEAGLFKFADVVAAINDKMVRRHPHVFGEERVEGAAQQTERWNEMKRAERAGKSKDTSALAGIGSGVPELVKALKLQQQAATVGFDWPSVAPVLDKLHEELEEVRAEFDRGERDKARLTDEIGDLLFVCVNLARHAKVDSGAALRHANAKFERRFRRMEQLATAAGTPLSELPLEAQDRYWDQAKSEEKGPA
jgi:ATP diphosphatase